MAQQRQQEEQERRRRASEDPAASVPSSNETLLGASKGSDASGRHRRWASLSSPMTMGLESMAEAFPLEQTGQQAVGRHVWVGNGGGGSQPSQQQHQKSPSYSGLASALAPPAEIYSLPPRKSSLTAASSSSASILAIGDPLPASPPPPPPKPPAKSLLGRSYTLRRHSPSSTPDPSSASSPPRAPSRMAAMAAATSSGGRPSRLVSIRQLPISLPIPPTPSSHTSTTTRAGQVTHDFIAAGGRPDFALDRGEPARPRLSAGDSQMTTPLWTPPSTPPESDRASERRPFKDLASELDVEHFGHLSESILTGSQEGAHVTSTRVNHCLPPSPPPEHDAPAAKIELPASSGASSLLKRSATIASQVRPRRKPVPTHLAGELAATSSPPQPPRRSSSEEEPPALRQAAQIATMGRPARNPKRNSIGAVYVLQPEMPLM